MKLSPEKSKYLIRFQNRLFYRSFLIDVMSQVGDRPVVIVPESTISTSKTHILDIGKEVNVKPKSDIDQLMESTDRSVTFSKEGYDPPPPKLPPEYDDDEMMQWRSKTGIDIVHPQSTPYELIRNYNNWLLMDEDKRKESDKMCQKFYYRTNQEHFEHLINIFKEDDEFLEGDIVDFAITSTKQTCRAYIDKIEETQGIPTKVMFKYLDNGAGRPFSEIDTFTLAKGDISNYSGPDIETTVGRFLINYLLLVNPFGNYVKYTNESWNHKAIEKEIAKGVMKDDISIDKLKSYQNNLFFIGHFAELCVPTFSKKSLGTDPNIAKLKKELLEKYKGKLTDPLVISEIENALIKADKDYLRDDSSMRFFGALGGKAFNVARKKMYLTVGGIETFSKDTGKYVFLPNSLTEGWEPKYMPTIANEIRKGSYSRGFETQLGGVQTKLITRVFQDLVVNHPDCGTSKGLKVDFTRMNPKDYLNRWLWSGSAWVELTEENLDKFKTGTYIVRSPMYCQAPTGLCYKCVGEKFRKLNVKQLAALEIDISSTFLTLSMKNMHGTKLELFELKDLDQFIIQ